MKQEYDNYSTVALHTMTYTVAASSSIIHTYFCSLKFGMNASSMQWASGYDLSHSLLNARRQLEGGGFFIVGVDGAIASAEPVETTGNVRGDQLRVGQVELTKNVTLLTKEILLMVTGGGERERERERERNAITLHTGGSWHMNYATCPHFLLPI